MESSVDIIAANPPLGLASYVSSNKILPPQSSPSLDAFLSQLSQSMNVLGVEIAALEELLQSKKESYARAKNVYDAHLRIRSPIRKVPQDLLGVIFPFTVAPPFNKYIDVARLRGVCSSWRAVALTIPGLWASLKINPDKWCEPMLDDWDNEAALLHFKEALAPWTCILDQNAPYQLHLTSQSTVLKHQRQEMVLVDHLLSSSPRPGSIFIGSQHACFTTFTLPSAYHEITKLQITNLSYSPNRATWPNIFPNLNTLVLDGMVGPGIDWLFHPSIQALRLHRLRGAPYTFVRLMQGLPSLRKLCLGSAVIIPHPDSNNIYSHPSLEALTVKGENPLVFCRRMAFPSLRFFSMKGNNSQIDQTLLSDVLPRILATMSHKGLTVALRGELQESFVTHVIRHLPPHSRLHLAASLHFELNVESDNLDEIFCHKKTRGLSWLGPGKARKSSSRPLVIHIPTYIGDDKSSQVQLRRDELEGSGYQLEMREPEEVDNMLYVLAPEIRAGF
ncbi:hypothetical protein BKA70DRAFT_1471134 [Coprinopsis sp. MPI-PUGE-AT-0042]|nr:hypothetical protein BKA70DRAFT_1471134 [Coprinopsis sp. MPI-PUGE-AT-0042]